MSKFEIIIASAPDRKRLVAEIYYDNTYWAEVSQEEAGGPFVLQFYSHPKEKCWEFTFDEVFDVLRRAKKKMLELDVPGNKEKSDFH